ncbi:MAG: hypothetical protein V9G12_03850 [Microthrixaceae bacterium]
MGLDQLLEPGHHVADVVIHREVAAAGEVGEHNRSGVAREAGEPLGERHRHGRGSGAATAGDGDQTTPPPAGGVVGGKVGGHGVGRRANRLGVGGEAGQERGCVERIGQDRVRPQRGPVAIDPRIGHDDHRRGTCGGGVDQVAVEAGGPAVDQQCRDRATGGEAGSDLGHADALQELDGDLRRVGPVGDVAEPRGPHPGEADDDEAFGAHGRRVIVRRRRRCWRGCCRGPT